MLIFQDRKIITTKYKPGILTSFCGFNMLHIFFPDKRKNKEGTRLIGDSSLHSRSSEMLVDWYHSFRVYSCIHLHNRRFSSTLKNLPIQQ
jgi:hypothetical protein